MNYSKVSLFDIANGNGIRVSLFLSGCKFHCPDCFNREAWNYDFGYPYTTNTQNIIIKKLTNENFQGLSLLGGDPLWQCEEGLQELQVLCDKCHEIGKDVWMWSGFTWEEVNAMHDSRFELLKKTDVFIEGRFEKDKRDLSLPWRGSGNQNIIDVQASLQTEEKVLYKVQE